MDEARLVYRRQFILCRDAIPALSHWNTHILANGTILYSHPDLSVNLQKKSDREICLLGYVFDPAHPAMSNEEILRALDAYAGSFNSFMATLKAYTGQFVFIYLDRRIQRVIPDALGLREVYYCSSDNVVICGSQPNLLKKFSDPQLRESSDPLVRRFYDKDLKRIRSGRFWVGDETNFGGIRHLLPNHFLEIPGLAPVRYWPDQTLPKLELGEIVKRSRQFLEGGLKASSLRHDLMMAVTAGTDSRTLLAASRRIKDKIYYFINKHDHLTARHPDIDIPSAMFKRIETPYHVHDLSGEIDPRFRAIFLDNTFMANEKILSAIYNVYYKDHGHRLNILGVGEIGREFFGKEPRKLDGYYLARSLKIKDSPYAVYQCQKWLDDTLPIARQYNVSIMTLLLWEQLLGNWGAVGNSESDIAIEEFDPFNSHYLYETLLSIDQAQLKKQPDIIFRAMIQEMWPELLDFPINPPFRRTDRIKRVLKSARLYSVLKHVLYLWDRAKFRFVRNRLR
jgi:hypothetical protein